MIRNTTTRTVAIFNTVLVNLQINRSLRFLSLAKVGFNTSLLTKIPSQGWCHDINRRGSVLSTILKSTFPTQRGFTSEGTEKQQLVGTYGLSQSIILSYHYPDPPGLVARRTTGPGRVWSDIKFNPFCHTKLRSISSPYRLFPHLHINNPTPFSPFHQPGTRRF
jgi:hypothetical protein